MDTRGICCMNLHSIFNFLRGIYFKMCRFRRKSFVFKIILFLGYCGFTQVKCDGENKPVATVPTPSSTQRSILVLKISPNFSTGGGSSSTNGDEFIRNLNNRLERYKNRISEYDTSNGRNSAGDSHSSLSPIRNAHYPYEYPYKPPLEDLDYHTNAILYFIAISIVIVAIGVVSCLCINKSTCHKAVGEMTARANAANSGNVRRATVANNRGSRVNSNLSIISGTTTVTSFSASPSVTNVNFSAGANSSPSSHYNNANFDDGIQIKVIHDLPPSYESLFPPTTASATENVSTTTTTESATANENNVETAKN